MSYSYLVRRKVLQLFGAAFHIYDRQNNLIGFSRQKAFKLKEDIRIYTDASQQQELLLIRARNIIDFSAAYDIVDSHSGVLLGTWQRKGFSSIIRDNWALYDAQQYQLATLQEDSMLLSLLRRFLAGAWLPQAYNLANAAGTLMAELRQRFNPFIFKMEVAIEPNLQLDPRLILAGAILLAAIEGRQG